jgi:prepilin-type processing-associated H-X9-DG protein
MNRWEGYLPPLNSAASYNANGTAKSYGMWDCIGPYLGRPEWGGISGIPGTPKQYGAFWSTKPQPENFQKSVFCCPEEPNTIAWDKGYAESCFLQPVGYFSGNNPRPWSVPRRVPTYSPSTKVHVSDSDDWHLGDLSGITPSNYTRPYADHPWDLYRHMKGTNVLFMDGHAAYYKADSVFKDLTRDPVNNKSIKNFCLP